MSDASVLTTGQVHAEVRTYIVDNFLFGNDDPTLTGDASFLETGIIDSTGILELIQYAESTYGIEIDDEDMIPENLDSLDRISAFVIRKRNAS